MKLSTCCYIILNLSFNNVLVLPFQPLKSMKHCQTSLGYSLPTPRTKIWFQIPKVSV